MSRPHRGRITGRLPKYVGRLVDGSVGARALFLVGLALLIAFPVLGWWAVVVGLGAMVAAARVRGHGSSRPATTSSRWWLIPGRANRE